MPILSEDQQMALLDRAVAAAALSFTGIPSHTCGASVLDYCRSCDEFYWVHPASGCSTGLHDKTHYGHRLTIIPFVEAR